MAKNKTYDIPYRTLVKKMSGRKTANGNNKWDVSTTKTGVVKDTNWKKLKQDVYKKAKDNNNLFANYEDRFTVRKNRVLRSTTKVFADGHKEVTYYGK